MTCSHRNHTSTTARVGDRLVTTFTCQDCQKKFSRSKKITTQSSVDAGIRFQKAKDRAQKAQERALTAKRVKTAKPAKDASKGLKTRKKAIAQKSESKTKWDRRYRDKIDQDTLFGVYYDLEWQGETPVVVRKIGNRLYCQRHHPLGRVNCRILFYRHVTETLHTFTHDNGKLSRKLGLLLPEFEGRESQEGQIDPLGILPEYRQFIEEP